MPDISINNAWRVALSVACLLFTSSIFVRLTFWGEPANALHLYGQSGCFVATILIVGCLAGFASVAALATSLVRK